MTRVFGCHDQGRRIVSRHNFQSKTFVGRGMTHTGSVVAVLQCDRAFRCFVLVAGLGVIGDGASVVDVVFVKHEPSFFPIGTGDSSTFVQVTGELDHFSFSYFSFSLSQCCSTPLLFSLSQCSFFTRGVLSAPPQVVWSLET